MNRPLRFGVVCNEPMTRGAWQDLARRAEGLGYSTLLTADHIGMPSPLMRAVSAADVTSVLRVGSYVLNAEFHRPLRLAQEAATADDLTGGRLELGLGSGWERSEFDLLGLPYDPPAARAARLDAAVGVMKRAWAGQVMLDRVRAVPAPAQRPHPPLLIGGHGDAILSVAARHAATVSLTGASLVGGAYRADGATSEAAAERVGFVRRAAGGRTPSPEINVRLLVVIVTDEGRAVTAKVAALHGVDPRLVAESPFALIGGRHQLADKLSALRERLGISYYTVPFAAIDEFAPVLAQLR